MSGHVLRDWWPRLQTLSLTPPALTDETGWFSCFPAQLQVPWGLGGRDLSLLPLSFCFIQQIVKLRQHLQRSKQGVRHGKEQLPPLQHNSATYSALGNHTSTASHSQVGRASGWEAAGSAPSLCWGHARLSARLHLVCCVSTAAVFHVEVGPDAVVQHHGA